MIQGCHHRTHARTRSHGGAGPSTVLVSVCLRREICKRSFFPFFFVSVFEGKSMREVLRSPLFLSVGLGYDGRRERSRKRKRLGKSQSKIRTIMFPPRLEWLATLPPRPLPSAGVARGS